MLGADVAVGGTYNYAGKIYSRLFEAVKAGDMKKASKLQIQSQKIIDIFLNHGNFLVREKKIFTKNCIGSKDIVYNLELAKHFSAYIFFLTLLFE